MTEYPETTEELLDKYPRIFEIYHEQDEIEGPLPPIVFGLAIGSGWVPLVDDLCADLQEIDPDVVAHQVKEKFGGLRFYTGGTSEEALERIREAEDEAVETCEYCGDDGERESNDGWIRTLCEPCRRQLKWQRYHNRQQRRENE